MSLTKEQIEKAPKIATRNMEQVLKELKITNLHRYTALMALRNSFTPNLKREDSREYLKKVKEKK